MSNFSVRIRDDRELNLQAEFFLDVSNPGDMCHHTIYAQAHQVNVNLLQLVLYFGKGGELCSTDRSKIGWMGEEDKPASPEILQSDGTKSRFGLKVRRSPILGR